MEKADNGKPDPPAQGECCENGCDPCVWDIYRDDLNRWNEQHKQLSDSGSENGSETGSEAGVDKHFSLE